MASVAEMKQLKNQIEKLDKTNQVDILKILRDSNSVILNENKSGVYINLTYCPQNVIEEVVKYLDYVTQQEQVLRTTEQEKDDVKTEYFKNCSNV